MVNVLFTAGGLGLAGIDPAGALVGVGLLGAGARRRNIVIMLITYVLGTIALGVALTLTVGVRISHVGWSEFEPPAWVIALILAILGIGLIAWGSLRVFHPAPSKKKSSKEQRSGALSLALLGIVLAIGSLASPPFLALIVIAGRYHSLAAVVVSHTVWILINQSPLIIITLTSLTGRGERWVTHLQRWWKRWKPVLAHVFTGIILLAGVVLLIESIWWVISRDFLFA